MTAVEPQPSQGRKAASRRMPHALQAVFHEEERKSGQLMIIGRTASLGIVAAFLPILVPFPEVIYYLILLGSMIVLGWVVYGMDRLGLYQHWMSYVFVVLDMAILAVALLSENPLASQDYPAQVGLRYGNHVYFFILLTGLAFSYRPSLIIWGGIVGASVWAFGVGWLASLPNSIVSNDLMLDLDRLMALYAEPTYVDIGPPIQEVLVFLIVTGLLTIVVARSRFLIRRQVRLERERANLARYFPSETVEVLSKTDGALSLEREQIATILFTDIVGFSAIAEKSTPQELIALLREVHSLVEAQVFAHHGTLDKFIGDGVMATFGTPEPSPDDAANAVQCVADILHSMDIYNEGRTARGLDSVHLSIGVHTGSVVVGDIGSERRLELAVLGDTVNVASRLENLTRTIGCRAVISDAVVRAVQESTSRPKAKLVEHGLVDIRGRAEDMLIWTL
ncbi:MAG: adenylate/guanylate cyclase domain-containing protein [Pseudomonadota bacterium]